MAHDTPSDLNKVMIHSFDVFDTCVSRMHAYPRDLFFDLGWRLAPSKSNDSARRRFARRFQRARILAEKIANYRARARHEVADISAIYANFRMIFRSGMSIEELVQAELNVEEESIYPVPQTIDRINALRANGHRILFISDMYIPKLLLTSILKKHGVMRDGDSLYVSCDSNATKHSGDLFRHILESENLTCSEITHTGDNINADIRMAQRCGIRSIHFYDAGLNQQELSVAGVDRSRSAGRSFSAAFSRRLRLSMGLSKSDKNHAIDEVICSVVAPFLISYVLWMLDDASRRGVQRLYFVARDGEILYEIARVLNPPKIQLRYLYGSRRAWLAPSITSDNQDWRRLLVVPGNSSAPYDIVVRAGINEDDQVALQDILGLSEEHWTTTLGEAAAKRFSADLMKNAEAAALILTSAKKKRDVAVAYFRQEGLLDGTNWALVDAGWSLNSQAALKRILKKSGQPSESPRGYYIGLARDHLGEDRAGEAFSFTAVGSIFSRRRVVVEHCFLPANHASTYGYKKIDDIISPIFGADARSDFELSYSRRLHEIVIHAARLSAENSNVAQALRVFTPDIKHVAENFIRCPDIIHARALAGIGAIADMRQEASFVQALCRPLSSLDAWGVLVMSLSRRKAFREPAYMWLEGSIALSSACIRYPLKFILWLDETRNRLRS